MNRNNINTVQSFIRTVAFLVTFGFLAFFSFLFVSVMSPDEAVIGILTIVLGIVNIWIASTVSRMFHILPEWERLVLLRLGKFVAVQGPGFFVIPPFVYSVASIVDTRITTQQVEATATLTKDNVPTKVTAAIEFQIENPQKAVIAVKDFLSSIIWLSTEALKNTIGSMDLRQLLSNRDEIATSLRTQIDKAAEEYGINVRAVRITDIDTPPSLTEELAVIARARRASEAKQIQAEAEVMVAEKIAEASKKLGESKGAFKLRELQNLSEMSKEESSMIIIYPSDSTVGKSIASASVSLRKRNMAKPAVKSTV